MFCLRACVSLETSGLRNRSTFGILCASGWEGEREGAKRGEDTQGGLSLYVTLCPCGRQMCVWVKWRGGWHRESVCLYACTLVYICILEHLCVLVFLTSSTDSNLWVCVCVGGGGLVAVEGPQGTLTAPRSPGLAAWAGLGFHWGSPSCLCVRHRLTIPMYI